MSKLRIGQIGIGHNHGADKMLTARKFPELYEVIGIAEPDESWILKRGDLPAYEGLPRMTVDEIIEKSDAVIVESDVWNLTKYAKMCVKAGKHIHMDKPASGTLEQFREVLDIAKAKGLVVQMGYMYRYNPAINMCLEDFRSGKLGEIYSINAEMSTFHSPEYKRWLTNFKGGIMYILGSHLVDLAVYMLGEPNRVTSFLKRTGLDGIDLEDNNLAVLEYDKAIARIFVSSVEVNGWGRRQFVVSGSRGTYSIMPIERKCHVTYSDTSFATNGYQDIKKEIEVPDVPNEIRYDIMMSDFHEYIMGTKTNPYTYEHDYLVQKVLYEICGGVACGDWQH